MRHPPAFTTIELLLVMSILAVVAAIAVWAHRPTLAPRAAAELARTVRHARWLAVTSASPTMLLAGGERRAVVLVNGPDFTCDPASVADAKSVWERPERGLSVAWPVRGIAFAPDGFPRSCLGDGVGSATVRLQDDATAAAVIVSSLGRVRWERR